jgi:hypothetical protein
MKKNIKKNDKTIYLVNPLLKKKTKNKKKHNSMDIE